MKYDAFISYSHTGDLPISQELQRGLRSFAKAWYRRSALSVFRDRTDLSAGPALWESIERALDQSRWFILLASSESANSSGVQHELERFLSNATPDRILIVVTNGDIQWDNAGGDFDWVQTTALPRVLQGRFLKEPQFVDLRWARAAALPSIRDTRFRDAIADLAATIRQVEKKDLIGEDLRQHRRTMRTAWASAITLGILAATASVEAWIASKERNKALTNEATAKRNEARAELETRKALQRLADSLLSQGENAALKSEWADARQLFLESFESFVASGADPSSATVNLWNAAWHSDPPVWILPGSSEQILVHWIGDSLLLSLDDQGLVRVWNLQDVPSKEREFHLPVNQLSGADQQGDLLILATLTGKMLAYNLRLNRTVWELERRFKCLSAKFSLDGRRAAFLEANGTVVLVDAVSGNVLKEASGFEGALFLEARSDGWAISEMDVKRGFMGWNLLEATTLARLNRLKPPGAQVPNGFHEGHRFLVTCSVGRIDFYDKATLSLAFSDTIDDAWPCLGGALPGQDYFLCCYGGKVRLCSEEGSRCVQIYDTGDALVSSTATALHPNGRWIAAGRRNIQIFHIGPTLESRVISEPFTGARALAASSDGRRVAIGHKDGDSPVLSVFDIASHSLLWRQRTSQDVTALTFSEDGSQIAVFVDDGRSRLTDNGHWEYDATVATVEIRNARSGSLQTSVSVLGKVQAVEVMQYLTPSQVILGDSEGKVLKCDLQTGECTETRIVLPRGVSAIAMSGERDLLLVSSNERSVIALGNDLVTRYRLELPLTAYVVSDVAFSKDSSLAYATAGAQLFVWDAQTGENVRSFHDPDALSGQKLCVLGDRVLTLGDRFALWDPERGRVSHIIAEYKSDRTWHFVLPRDCLRILALQYLANGNEQRLVLWDAQRGEQYAKFMRNIDLVHSETANPPLESAAQWYAFRGLSGAGDSQKENSSTATRRSD